MTGGIPGVCRTVMQRGPAQLSSVSDLYVSDEISVLLEEIHDLEPKGNIAPIDDEQEFEINGSQTGGSWLEVTNSMAGTPGSWDSHANYKHQEASRARYNGVVVHYEKRPMKTPSGVIRVLLLVSFALYCLCNMDNRSKSRTHFLLSHKIKIINICIYLIFLYIIIFDYYSFFLSFDLQSILLSHIKIGTSLGPIIATASHND